MHLRGQRGPILGLHGNSEGHRSQPRSFFWFPKRAHTLGEKGRGEKKKKKKNKKKKRPRKGMDLWSLV